MDLNSHSDDCKLTGAFLQISGRDLGRSWNRAIFDVSSSTRLNISILSVSQLDLRLTGECDSNSSVGRQRIAAVIDYQMIDVFNDHLCYVVTDRKTPWHLPYRQNFTLLNKIVITHFAKSRCKLAIYIKVDWADSPRIVKGEQDLPSWHTVLLTFRRPDHKSSSKGPQIRCSRLGRCDSRSGKKIRCPESNQEVHPDLRPHRSSDSGFRIRRQRRTGHCRSTALSKTTHADRYFRRIDWVMA